jgi:hypothetical protein
MAENLDALEVVREAVRLLNHVSKDQAKVLLDQADRLCRAQTWRHDSQDWTTAVTSLNKANKLKSLGNIDEESYISWVNFPLTELVKVQAGLDQSMAKLREEHGDPVIAVSSETDEASRKYWLTLSPNWVNAMEPCSGSDPAILTRAKELHNDKIIECVASKQVPGGQPFKEVLLTSLDVGNILLCDIKAPFKVKGDDKAIVTLTSALGSLGHSDYTNRLLVQVKVKNDLGSGQDDNLSYIRVEDLRKPWGAATEVQVFKSVCNSDGVYQVVSQGDLVPETAVTLVGLGIYYPKTSKWELPTVFEFKKINTYQAMFEKMQETMSKIYAWVNIKITELGAGGSNVSMAVPMGPAFGEQSHKYFFNRMNFRFVMQDTMWLWRKDFD